jgi:5,10-methylenetetrahydrofolate reductase
MSCLSHLENILMDAYEKNLVEQVCLRGDYIKVVLHDTNNGHDTLIELTNYIKKNFSCVRYFQIDLLRLTFNIYHFNELRRTQRLSEQEKR